MIGIEASLICRVSRRENAALLVFATPRLRAEAPSNCLDACVGVNELKEFLEEVLGEVKGSMIRSFVKEFRKSKLHLLIPFLGWKLGVRSEPAIALAIIERALEVVTKGRYEGVRCVCVSILCSERGVAVAGGGEVEDRLRYLVENDDGVRGFLEELCRSRSVFPS